jgi:hypothetical protein
MRPVQTKLDDATIAKIQATGMSVYEFLQKAIDEKLRNDKVLEINESIDYRLREFEKRLLSVVEDRVVEGVAASRKIHEESLRESLNREEEMRGKLNTAFSKIREDIAALKK